MTDCCLARVLENARLADDAADVLVVQPPFYFRPSRDELRRLVRAVLGASARPVALYDIPRYAKAMFGVDLIRELAQTPRVIAYKDSTGDRAHHLAVLEATRGRRDFAVLCGHEALLGESLLAGGHGAVPGGPYFEPATYVAIARAASAGDAAGVRRLAERVGEIARRLLFLRPDDDLGTIKSLKAALSVLGLCRPTMAAPFDAPDAGHIAEARDGLRALGLLPSEARP